MGGDNFQPRRGNNRSSSSPNASSSFPSSSGDQGPDVTNDIWPSSNSSSSKGSNGNANGRSRSGIPIGGNSSRRIFTNEFKQNVLDAFNTDPECIGNQRATARKFGIHRRQVQKWLQQPQVKDESVDESLPSISQSEEVVGIGKRSLRKRTKESPKVIPAESTSPKEIDLSKLSVSAMATSLNLIMNSNSMNNSLSHSTNPMSSLLHLQASRISPPFYNINSNKFVHRNESPANLSNSSSGSTAAQVTIYNDHLEIVDEIAYMYPHEDFNLLRQALLRNDVTFTKVKGKFLPPHSHPPKHQNRIRTNHNQPTPIFVSPQSESTAKHNNNYSAQQALELIRQQSEYVKLLQQSGLNLPFSPQDLHAFAELHNNHKYPSNLQQNVNSLTTSNLFDAYSLAYASGKSSANRSSNSSFNKRKPSATITSSNPIHTNHTFVSPKVPSNSKPKTVAAALAASRLSPTIKYGMNDPIAFSKSRQSHQRKRQPRQTKSSGILEYQDEDFIDPTTMLEITTTSNSGEENGVDLSSYSHSHSNGIHLVGNHVSPVSAASTSQSRKSPEVDSELTKYLALEAYANDPEVAGDARALARKFGLNIRVVMKWIKEGSLKFTLPHLNGIANLGPGSYDSSTNPIKLLSKHTNGGNGGTLDMSMMKLINNFEHSTSHLNYMNSDLSSNEDLNKKKPDRQETDDLLLKSANFHKNILANMSTSSSSTFSSSNKRKTSKPNQICDFVQEENICFNEGPVDMIVPIKKRRLSTQD